MMRWKTTMTRQILVPLDGSPLSEHALPLATALVRTLDARLLLVHAQRADTTSSEHPPDLDAVAQRIRSGGIDVETATCSAQEVDGTGAAILSAAGEHDAALIVMATHGYGGLGRWLYGSVADQLVRQTTVPIMLVSPLLAAAWPEDRPPRVLVPLDGSERSEAILGPLGALVKPLGGQLILLHVSESIDYLNEHPDYCEVCRAARAAGTELDIEPVRARLYLDGVAGRLRADGFTVTTQVETGGAASTIVKVAEQHQADLIAMATHGRSGLRQVIMGSVATDTLRRADVPLLLVRSLEADASS